MYKLLPKVSTLIITVTALCSQLNAQTISFTAPDTVCVGTAVTPVNTSTGSTYYWNYCNAGSANIPVLRNIGNPSSSLTYPVMSTIIVDGGNYYVFVLNHVNPGNTVGNLLRMDFGNSLLNTPSVTNLGNMGVIPYQALGISVKKDGNNWYAFIVGGSTFGSSVARINFGTSITNPSPTAASLGNIGGMAYPFEIFVFKEGSSWYGYVTNCDNHTISRLSFGSSLANTPTGSNLGNIGVLNRPFSARFVKDGSNWYAYVMNYGNSTMSLLSFGNSLLNTPTGNNLGNPGNLIAGPNDMFFLRSCNETSGYIVNYNAGNTIVKLNFANNNLAGPVTATTMGNPTSLNQPHDFSDAVRIGDSLYSVVVNPGNNTMSLFIMGGCTTNMFPSSTAVTPSPVTYTTPGIYTINLSMDDGLPTQNKLCREIVVVALPSPVISQTGILSTGIFRTYQWYKNGVAIPGATLQTYAASTDGNYHVVVTGAGNCSNSSNTVSVKSNGVINPLAALIKIFPNPTTTTLFINSPVKVNAVLFSVDGKKVVDQKNASSIQLAHVALGYYLLHITDEDGKLILVEKIIKSE